MSIIPYYLLLDDDETPFVFQVDTRNINSGATDGSENPLTFRIPIRTANGANINTRCIVKVSDGRSDISITSHADIDTKCLISFSSAGIYTITIIGYVQNFGFYYSGGTVGYYGHDKKKIILISQWGNRINFETRAFYNCVNLVVNASDTLMLPPVPSWFFQSIKEIKSSLLLIDTSKATDMWRILSNISVFILPSGFNPFFQSLTSVTEMYPSITFTPNVNKIEIISDTVTTLSQPWNSVVFQNAGTIELICQTPNLATMYRVFYNGEVRTRCHGGKIDVRNVTNTDQWLNATMPQTNVDATLLGWANLPSMKSGVTWNWNGSKYSNNPAVIAAYNKITITWGVIFTNLTMA